MRPCAVWVVTAVVFSSLSSGLKSNQADVPAAEAPLQEAAAAALQHAQWAAEVQKNASYKIWTDMLAGVHEKIKAVPIVAARANATDRVALTVLQPADPERIKLMAQIIRLNMVRLGPKWACQIMYAQESEREALDQLLDHPPNLIWSPIKLHGERVPTLGRFEFSYWLLDMDFWGEVRPEHEHVLIFGDDSIVLKGNGCVDRFLYYDYAGAPWSDAQANMPRHGGNGGFSLRRRSVSVDVISDHVRLEEVKATGPKRQRHHEDEAFVRLIFERGGTFPSREAATQFCVETMFNEDACAVHKPWLYQDPVHMRRLMNAADKL